MSPPLLSKRLLTHVLRLILTLFAFTYTESIHADFEDARAMVSEKASACARSFRLLFGQVRQIGKSNGSTGFGLSDGVQKSGGTLDGSAAAFRPVNKRADAILSDPRIADTLASVKAYLQHQMEVAGSIAPAELRQMTVEGTVKDRFIVKQAGGLSLVKSKGIGKADYEVQKLRGDEIKNAGAFGDYIVVETRSVPVRGDPELFHLHVMKPDGNVTVLDSYSPIRNWRVDGIEGTVLAADRHLVFFTNPAGNPRGTESVALSVSGKIEEIKKVRHNGVDLVEVRTTGEGAGTHFVDFPTLAQSGAVDHFLTAGDKYGNRLTPFGQNSFALVNGVENGETRSSTISYVYRASESIVPGKIQFVNVQHAGEFKKANVNYISGDKDHDLMFIGAANVDPAKPKEGTFHLVKKGQPPTASVFDDSRILKNDDSTVILRQTIKEGEERPNSTKIAIYRKTQLRESTGISDKTTGLQRSSSSFVTFEARGSDISLVGPPTKGTFPSDKSVVYLEAHVEAGNLKSPKTTVFVDLRTNAKLDLGNVIETREVSHGGEKYLIILSEDAATKNPRVAVWDKSKGLFLNTQPCDFGWRATNGVSCPMDLGMHSPAKDLSIRLSDDKRSLVVSGKAGPEQKFKEAVTVIPVDGQGGSPRTFFNPYTPKIEGMQKGTAVVVAEQSNFFNPNVLSTSVIEITQGKKTMPLEIVGRVDRIEFDGNEVRIAGTHIQHSSPIPTVSQYTIVDDGLRADFVLFRPYEPKIEGLPPNSQVMVADQIGKYDPKVIDKAVVVFQTPDGKRVPYPFEGIVDRVEFAKGTMTVHGRRKLLTHDVPIETHFVLGSTTPQYTLINKRAAPELVDPKSGMTIFATDPVSDQVPRTVIFDKEGRFREVPLQFVTSQKKQDDFFSMMLGVPAGEEKVTVINRSPVAGIEIKEDLLLVSTASKGEVPRTYVYNLKTDTMELSVPNLKGVVDVDDYRFYVGHPAPGAEAVVALYDRKNNRYLRHFDMGQVKVDVSNPDAIVRDPKTKQIRFRLANGAHRVYDEASNTFLGYVPKDVLDEFEQLDKKLGTVLNDQIFGSNISPVIGRNAIVEQMRTVHTFSEGIRANGASKFIVIKGESGAGRSVMLQNHIADYMSGLDVGGAQTSLRPVFFQLDPSMIKAGTSYRGQGSDKWVELQRVANTIRKRGYQMVLIVDDVDELAKSMLGGKYLDEETNFFTQLARMKKKQVPMDVIVTSRTKGWEYIGEKSGEFSAGFHEIDLQPMTRPETVSAVRKQLDAAYPGKKLIDDATLTYAVSTISRLNSHRVLPGEAFDIVKDLAQEVAETCKRGGECSITVRAINGRLAGRTGLPEPLISGEPAEAKKFVDDMRAHVKRQVTGQDPAVDEIIDAFESFAVGMNQKDVPIFSFLSPGSTGVGKTETAKAIRSFLFKDEKRMMKINGADYQSPISGEKIAELSEQLALHNKRYPFNMLLVDEVEKMDLGAVKVFLSYLDGDLTDRAGNLVPTSNSMVIATSNLGQQQILTENLRRRAAGLPMLTQAERKEMQTEGIFHHFRSSPELIRRFDGITHYQSLDQSTARSVVQIYLERHVLPDLSEKKIGITYDGSFLDLLGRKYVDEMFGGRGTSKKLKTDLTNKVITKRILDGTLKPGRNYKVVAIEVSEDKLEYRFIEVKD